MRVSRCVPRCACLNSRSDPITYVTAASISLLDWLILIQSHCRFITLLLLFSV
eukprot:m.258538 g.258538  ORF g.258538 m.258538 type:complete len:53 (+) comp31205_c0_seq1:56-214(+)